MSTEEILDSLLKKVDSLEEKVLSLITENKELTEVIKLNDREYRKIYKKIYEQSYKNYKENKILKKAIKEKKSNSI